MRIKRRLNLGLNLGSLTYSVTQIVELCSANLTVADYVHGYDVGRMQREGLFYAYAVRDVAYGETFLDTAVLSCDNDTLEVLDSFLAAFLCSLYAVGWQKAKPMPEQALLAALATGQQVSARNCMAQGGFGCKAEISRDSIE